MNSMHNKRDMVWFDFVGRIAAAKSRAMQYYNSNVFVDVTKSLNIFVDPCDCP